MEPRKPMTNNSAATHPQSQKLDEAIGSMSRAWGHVELAMTAIMGELMETPPETAMVVSAALDFRHRRDLITSLAAIKLKGHPFEEQLTEFISRVRGMNKERNG